MSVLPTVRHQLEQAARLAASERPATPGRRARLSVRRLGATLVVGIVAVGSIAIAFAVLSAVRSRPTASHRSGGPPGVAAGVPLTSCPRSVRGLGRIAVAVRGGLQIVDLGDCRRASYQLGAIATLHFSPDGRWLAYSDPAGKLSVIRADGGTPRTLVGAGVGSWSWAARGALLYAVDGHGALLAVSPEGSKRTVAQNVDAVLVAAAGGRLALENDRCVGPDQGELDLLSTATGRRTTVLREAVGQPKLAGFSPDGRWLLFWPESQCSSSLAADGYPLEAVSTGGGRPVRAIGHMLLFQDYLTWCDGRLIAAAGPSRETQLGGALIASAPPNWRQRTIASPRRLSWVSPTCSPAGTTLAAAAGRDSQNAGFGLAHRSIWLLTATGRVIRRLTAPPSPGLSDEAPRFSGDGRWILFVRTHVVTVGQSAYSTDTLELVSSTGGAKPIELLHFTSGDFSYYDHFSWPEEIDWSRGS